MIAAAIERKPHGICRQCEIPDRYRVLGVSTRSERVQMLAHEEFQRSLRRGLELAPPHYAGQHTDLANAFRRAYRIVPCDQVFTEG
jgi:hypothetical protein